MEWTTSHFTPPAVGARGAAREAGSVSNTAWFIYAVVGALVSLVGLSVAIALRELWIAVVAAVALVAFAGAAALFVWGLWLR